MNSNETELQERIARAIYGAQAHAIFPDELGEAPKWVQESVRTDAAAVLPIIHAEVAKGKAEAWDEGNHAGTRDQANWDGWRYPRGYQEHVNPYRTEQNDGR